MQEKLGDGLRLIEGKARAVGGKVDELAAEVLRHAWKAGFVKVETQSGTSMLHPARSRFYRTSRHCHGPL